jgi:DeoR/GlpR family transcriptional regulator of sugar metabolism
LAQIRADIVMPGVCGLHPEVGVTTDDIQEAHVKRVMIDGAADVVALADHDKLGTAMAAVVGPLRMITKLVTDDAAGDLALEPYRDAGVEVITV